jgi:FKBP-type peptidyl-prolyl cis-trans isomerase
MFTKRTQLVVSAVIVTIAIGYFVRGQKNPEDSPELPSGSAVSNSSQQGQEDASKSASSEPSLSSDDPTVASNNQSGSNATKVPSQVLSKDLKIGHTKIVTPGTRVSFHIMAKLADGKIVFDSQKASRPWTGTVGTGSLLPGIDRGIRGMMIGGKRALWISPDLAYGENGITGQIPPNAKIYAEIDLLEVY